MSPVFTLLHWIHSSPNDSPQIMHFVCWYWERGSGVGFSLFERLLTFFGGLWQLSKIFDHLFQLIFKRWWRQNLTFQDPSLSDNRFFEESGRGDKVLSTSLTSSVLTEDLEVILWSLLEAKAEALVDGSGSFSVAAALLQTWVVDCSAWFAVSGISVKAEPIKSRSEKI
jgi:hypothetical protein